VTFLLDGNVLIALAFPEHEHASRARPWFAGLGESFATCPITQGSLVRFLLRQGSDGPIAKAVLASFTELPHHVFWPDSVGFGDVRLEGVVGHAQVTDAYLAQLARFRGGRLATFDEGLASLHRDVSELIS
jgi:uncharacterized protein